jgi:MFS family permease
MKNNNKPLTRFNQILANSPVFYGWVVVAIVFITMGIGVNVRTAFSLLYPAILQEFGWGRAETAATFTIGFICAGLLSPLIGRASDIISPRYLLSLSAILVSLGMVLATFAYLPWHIYATLGLLVIGTGVVITYVGHSLFLPAWFERRRGLAIGVAFSGVGIGSITLMPLVQEMIETLGWREACWFMAGLLIIIVLPLNLLFQRKSPGELGLLPDGEKHSEDGSSKSSAIDPILDKEWAQTDWSLKLAMQTKEFWWMSLAAGTALYVWYAVQVHQTKYLLEVGFSTTEASFALGLVGFAGVVGQIYLGHMSDRIGREWVWTISLIGFGMCYVLLLVMAEIPSSILLYSMVFLQGGLGYAAAAVFGAMPADLYQGKRYGEIFGVYSLLALVGGGIGPWVTGYLFDFSGSYGLGFGVAAVLSLVSILAVWLAAPRRRRLVAGQAEKRALAQAAEV